MLAREDCLPSVPTKWLEEACRELLVSKSWLSSCVDEDAVDSMDQFLVGSLVGHWPLMCLDFREESLVSYASYFS